MGEQHPKRPQHREWKDALVPAIRVTGSTTDGKLWERNNAFYEDYPKFPELGIVEFGVLRYSKIKVRKYGSGYQVDKHEDRLGRWERTDLSGHISSLWKQPDAYGDAFRAQAKLFLFTGFDKTPDPLRCELNQLQHSLNWEKKNVTYLCTPDTTKPNAASECAWAFGHALFLIAPISSRRHCACLRSVISSGVEASGAYHLALN